MPYTAGDIAHRYLGHGQCIEVKVESITEDGRVVLADGSLINRFTKSYYHQVNDCPVPRLKVITGGQVTVKFPVVSETRTYQSSQPAKRGPYTTERLSNGGFKCDCPWRTYHPADDCGHIKDWKRELSQSTD